MKVHDTRHSFLAIGNKSEMKSYFNTETFTSLRLSQRITTVSGLLQVEM